MKAETKVGLLFIVAFILVILFAYYIGALNPFSDTNDVFVMYNFAGGVEVGSPVRVMGVKVGKVREIIFDPSMKDSKGQEVKLKLRISISKKAWDSVRKDSKFFINLAGVIGEKFIEISPGSSTSEKLKPADMIRGEDPPRIDQLISQSYGLAGKILDFVEKNEDTVSDTLNKIDNLVKNLNKTLLLLDKVTKNKDAEKLIRNTIKISEELVQITSHLNTADAKKTYDLVNRLIWRLDGLDSKSIKKFLQEEGIKAKLF